MIDRDVKCGRNHPACASSFLARKDMNDTKIVNLKITKIWIFSLKTC